MTDKTIMWKIRDFVEMFKSRQDNQFDNILAVSGERGYGKSSFIYKIFNRFEVFNPWKHIVYARKEAIQLLEQQKYGLVFDDEAIRTGYKRNFQDTDQKLLIQMLNMYRDNFNIYAMAIPKFYSLDKGLRDLIKFHVHLIQRGLGVVHISKSSALYSDDPWDIYYNSKIEEKWAKTLKQNPNFHPPYYKLSTFAGYIKFNPLQKNMQALYNKIKKLKRKRVYDDEMNLNQENKPDPVKEFYNKLIPKIKAGEVNQADLIKICYYSGVNVNKAIEKIRALLKEQGEVRQLRELLAPKKVNSDEEVGRRRV